MSWASWASHYIAVERALLVAQGRRGRAEAVGAVGVCGAEMALSVLVYNLTPGINIVGIKPLIAAIAV